jgi:hypothetical protein
MPNCTVIPMQNGGRCPPLPLGFIALDSKPGALAIEGAESGPTPSLGFEIRHGARVASQRCPILQTDDSTLRQQ